MDPSYNSSLGNLNPGGANPNGGFPQPSQPLSSGQGDIMLNTAQSKKSKKWIIVIGIFVLALIFLLIGFLFIKNLGYNNASNFKASFNNYANYLINGEISDNDLENEFSFNKQYALEQVLASDNKEDIRSWLQKADELLQVMKDEYASSKEQSVILSTYINSSKNALDFLEMQTSIAELTDNEILELYRTSGYEAAIQRIKQQYSAYTESESPYANRYGEALIIGATNTVDIIKLAQDANCDIANMEQVERCSYTGELQNNYLEKATKKTEYLYMVDKEYKEAYISLERFCWNIRDELNAKTDLEAISGEENE